VADLTKDWEEEGENDGSAGEAEETIESIVNFIQDENQTAGTEPQPPKDSEVAANAAAEAAPAETGGKKEKSRQEWVTLIFGEDGKEIQAPPEKSVYDLDPDEEDKNGELPTFCSS